MMAMFMKLLATNIVAKRILGWSKSDTTCLAASVFFVFRKLTSRGVSEKNAVSAPAITADSANSTMVIASKTEPSDTEKALAESIRQANVLVSSSVLSNAEPY